MCFIGSCKSATDFASYVLKVDRYLMDDRSAKKAQDYLYTLAILYDDGASAEDAASRLDSFHGMMVH